MCTSLTYRDAQDRVYFGRTLELTIDLPYKVVFIPRGMKLRSELEGRDPVDYEASHAFVSVTMPGRIPTKDAPLTVGDFKPLEGMNDKGLTFSLLSNRRSTALRYRSTGISSTTISASCASILTI